MKLVNICMMIGICIVPVNCFAMDITQKSILDEIMKKKREKYEKKVSQNILKINKAAADSDVVFTDKKQRTWPLIFKYCTKDINVPFLKLLLTKQVDPDVYWEKEYTPLTNALFYGADKNALVLLDNGADPDVTGRNPKDDLASQYSPLVIAIRTGNVTMAQELLKHKADPNFCNELAELPLIAAVNMFCKCSNDTYDMCVLRDKIKKIITLLIKNGADPKRKDGSQSALGLLKEKGAYPDIEALMLH